MFSSRASIGKIGIAAVPLTTNQGFINLIPGHGVESRYLAWCLHFHADRIADLAGSTTFKEVSKNALKSFRIPRPPVCEQRRIVEILDQADRLRRLWTEADIKADRLLPALFLGMFGDPATNPMGWPNKRIGDVCTIVSGATPKTNRSEFWGGGIPWATPKDLSVLEGWSLNHTERTLTGDGLASCSATMMPEKSVLLSSRAPIGLVAVSGVPMCTNQGFKSLVCGPDVDPWYLFGWCKLRRMFLQSLGRGVTFKEISKRIVESVELPVPPIKEQRHFREILESLMSIERERRRSVRRFVTLLDVLSNQAFSGDLTASWRSRHMKELFREMKRLERSAADAAP
jgi:restriction endonuclease S subunit